jgi:hypothetical protein
MGATVRGNNTTFREYFWPGSSSTGENFGAKNSLVSVDILRIWMGAEPGTTSVDDESATPTWMVQATVSSSGNRGYSDRYSHEYRTIP